MEDNYYIRLYHLETKPEYHDELAQGMDVEKAYYAGFMTNYANSVEPKITGRLTGSAFWLHKEEAEYVNICLDKKFNVEEHKIRKNVFMNAPISEKKESEMTKFKVATQWKKQARFHRKYRPLIRVKNNIILTVLDLYDRTFNRGPVRIVERTKVNGDVVYIIQRQNLLWWSDCQGYGVAEFKSLKKAQKELCYYDGTKQVDVVIDIPPKL